MKSKKYEDKKLISIIVPVYNVEPYLKRCLDSIINQTYTNIEIILIDDGSTDNSGSICDDYSKQDKRIKVIHKKNSGPSAARNSGLKMSSGEYIGFVDSDDYIETNYLERMMTYNKNYNVVMCRTRRINGDNINVPRSFDYDDDYVILNGKESFALLCTEKIDCSCCDKLFSKDVKHLISFPDGKINEELEVLTKIFINSEEILYIKDILYSYCSRPNSVTSTPFNSSQFDKVYNSYKNVYFIRNNEPSLIKFAKSYFVRQCFYLYKKLILNDNLKIKYLNDYIFISKSLKKYYAFTLFSGLFRIKEKISIFYALFFYRLYVKQHKQKC